MEQTTPSVRVSAHRELAQVVPAQLRTTPYLKLDRLARWAFKDQLSQLESEKTHLENNTEVSYSFLLSYNEDVKELKEINDEYAAVLKEVEDLEKANPEGSPLIVSARKKLPEINNRRQLLLNKIADEKKQRGGALNQVKQELVTKKEEALLDHIAQVSTAEKCKMVAKKVLEKMLFVRTYVTRQIIHPATVKFTSKKLNSEETFLDEEKKVSAKEGYANFDEDINLSGAERITFFSRDHQQLDGCVIFADGKKDNNRPTLVMSQGNEQLYEFNFETAKQYSEKYNVNVLLYNSRGIAKSLGTTRTTGHDVEDCKAAIRYALKNHSQDDPKKLGLYGHSLGGGVTAVALEGMIKDGEIPKEGIGLYINHHSFSSLKGFLQGFGVPKWIASSLIAVGGMNNLNAEKAVTRTRLADKVVVVSSANDQVMRKKGRLRAHKNLQKRVDDLRSAKLSRPMNQVVFIDISDWKVGESEFEHNYEQEYLDNEGQSSETERELQKYNEHLNGWANPI